jgi:hydrogenase maturation protease
MKILIFGYGNPDRGDDALGRECVLRIEARQLSNIAVEIGTELDIEHAALLAKYERAVLVDAAAMGPEPFSFQELRPENPVAMSSHSLSPGGLLWLAHTVFGSRTRGYTLAIRGYAFKELCCEITDSGKANLQDACTFLNRMLMCWHECERGQRASVGTDAHGCGKE